MYETELKRLIQNSKSLLSALEQIQSTFGEGRLAGMLYGFFVHLHSRDRNDALFVPSGFDETIAEKFISVGGTATDIAATKLETLPNPFLLDIDALADTMRTTKDFRLPFAEKILSLDLHSAWICPINRPWVGGFGVLNQFYRERASEPVIPRDLLSDFAHSFHQEAVRCGLLAKEIGLTRKQINTLAKIAMGKTARDLEAEFAISTRAVDKRLQNIRTKLKARNTLEAVYKATIYGVLPSQDEMHLIDTTSN